MNDHYENIKNNATCSECNGTNMGIAYIFEGGGAVKKKGSALGMETYTGAANMLMIVCNGCGFVARSFVIAR